MKFVIEAKVVRNGEEWIIENFESFNDVIDFIEGETEAEVMVNGITVASFKDEDEIDDTPVFED